MADRPDFYDMTLIAGRDSSGNLVTIAVDASGNIIGVMKGDYGGALKTIAVDSLGQLITILKGASGYNVLVDSQGFLTALMKGAYAGSPVTIAVDASGNIIGVLKGDYAGTLKTLAVDSQGRIQAVLTDPEDVFGNPHYMGAAELAARLGSIDTFDRRGNIIWYDDFEDNLNKWATGTSGVGASVILSSDAAHNGGLSCKLTTGNVAGNSAYIIHYSSYPVLTKIGFEISFTVHANTRYICFVLILYDGTNYLQAVVRYDHTTGNLEYLSSLGTYLTFATITKLPAGATYFLTAKLVVDFTTQKYLRFILNEVEYDLSAYDTYKLSSTTSPHLEVSAVAYTNVNANISTYVDDAIITQNEP